jgi:hypothetical protein
VRKHDDNGSLAMKDRFPPDVYEDAHLLGSLPRSCCRLCTRCAELDAEFRVLLLIAGEECIELLCSLCAGKALRRDLDATPVLTEEPRCIYVDVDTLDQLFDRQASSYRGRRWHLVTPGLI